MDGRVPLLGAPGTLWDTQTEARLDYSGATAAAPTGIFVNHLGGSTLFSCSKAHRPM